MFCVLRKRLFRLLASLLGTSLSCHYAPWLSISIVPQIQNHVAELRDRQRLIHKVKFTADKLYVNLYAAIQLLFAAPPPVRLIFEFYFRAWISRGSSEALSSEFTGRAPWRRTCVAISGDKYGAFPVLFSHAFKVFSLSFKHQLCS